MSQSQKNSAILLVNLGTPSAPNSSAVKRFLKAFLSDKRVIDVNRWLWTPLLNGVILPVRAPKVARLYQSIWMDGGSPLMVYSQRQVQKLSEQLNLPVAVGMTYGEPSILSAMQRLQQQGADNIVVLPLYPQYSVTTNAAVSDALGRALMAMQKIPSYHFIDAYYQHPLYIKALADSVRRHWQQNGQADYLLCSFHGIPKRYADNGDVYPQHCEATTRLLAQELGLTTEHIGMSYQSRFGREEWLQPYTDKTLPELARQGKTRLDIISPAFSVDCLETLEEIAEQCQEIFLAAGGKEFRYIPCLNDNDAHIRMMQALVEQWC